MRAMDYLLKPYNEQELVFAVEDAIRQVSVQLPARPAQPPAPAEPLRREEDEDMRTADVYKRQAPQNHGRFPSARISFHLADYRTDTGHSPDRLSLIHI